MTRPILVITEKNGLSSNLIRLALLQSKKPVKFTEPHQLDPQLVRESSWIIVDDRSFPSPKKVEEALGPSALEKKLIFLVRNPVSPKLKKGFSSWTFLSKPFNPRELQGIMREPAKD